MTEFCTADGWTDAHVGMRAHCRRAGQSGRHWEVHAEAIMGSLQGEEKSNVDRNFPF